MCVCVCVTLCKLHLRFSVLSDCESWCFDAHLLGDSGWNAFSMSRAIRFSFRKSLLSASVKSFIVGAGLAWSNHRSIISKSFLRASPCNALTTAIDPFLMFGRNVAISSHLSVAPHIRSRSRGRSSQDSTLARLAFWSSSPEPVWTEMIFLNLD